MNVPMSGIRWISEVDNTGQRLRDLSNVPTWAMARRSRTRNAEALRLPLRRVRIYMHPMREARP